MKYLDEEIILNFNNLPITTYDQSYPYYLYQNSSIAFAGSAFKRKTDSSLSINVTELLQSMHYQNDALLLPLRDISTYIPEGVVDSIHAEMLINSSTYSSQNEDVTFVYRYPHYLTKLNQTWFYPPNYQYVALTNNLQGYNNSNIQKVLYPRIPFTGSDQYGFGVVYQQHNFPTAAVYFSGDLIKTYPLNASKGCNIWYRKLSTMGYDAQMIKLTDMLEPLYPHLVSGQARTGTGSWSSTTSGDFVNTNNQSVYIAMADTNGYTFSRSIDLKTLPTGYHELSHTMKGNMRFYQFIIGSQADNLKIPVIAGREDIFQDAMIRTFTVKFHADIDHENQVYKIEDLTIICNKTGQYCLSLGSCKLCDIDLECVEDYYLQWIDRYGSFQSQPFKGSAKYTEKTESLEIQNYTGERRKTYFSTQGTFQINSGYIKESVYPIYESIYTSPYLLLYDVKNNKSYNVICTDTSYEEKTYKNNKALINLLLNLEINKTQSKIY